MCLNIHPDPRAGPRVNCQWNSHWHSLGSKSKRDSDRKQPGLQLARWTSQLWLVLEKARLKSQDDHLLQNSMSQAQEILGLRFQSWDGVGVRARTGGEQVAAILDLKHRWAISSSPLWGRGHVMLGKRKEAWRVWNRTENLGGKRWECFRPIWAIFKMLHKYCSNAACGKHLCSKPVYLKKKKKAHALSSSSISWKSGTCYLKSHPLLCRGSHQIQQLSPLEPWDKMTLWARQGSTEHPSKSRWRLSPAAVNLSAAFIGPLSSGLWAVLGMRCHLLCTNAYGPSPHRCKGLLPTRSLSVTLDNSPAANVPAHL